MTTDVVAEAQARLLRLSQLEQQAAGATRALEALLDRHKVQRGPKTTVAEATSQLNAFDDVCARLRKASEALGEADALFLSAIQDGAANGGAAGFKTRKLRSDYDRRLHVKTTSQTAEQTLRRAQVAMLELRKRASLAPAIATPTPAATPAPRLQPFAVHAPPPAPPQTQCESAQQLALREFDETRSSEAETAQLRHIARNAQLVHEMAAQVGSLVAVQSDDVERLQDNTDDSVARTLEGVHELSAARRRQAGSGAVKAGLGSATVGGLVGILGGPLGIALGAAAGGMVGALAGKGVAAVKRRSINAETRRIKALLAARAQQSRGGDFNLQVSAFELQPWSYLQRRWLEREARWVDEFGDALQGAHPGPPRAPGDGSGRDMSAVEARMQLLVAAHADGADLTAAELSEMEAALTTEARRRVDWQWASPRWQTVQDRPGTDLAGWEYAASSGADVWLPEAARGCVVRRRLWTRWLRGTPASADADARRSAHESLAARVARIEQGASGGTAGERERAALWSGIYRSAVETGAVMSDSRMHVSQQGEHISRAERDATLVGDVAAFTQRIDRAARLSGALRNMVTWQRADSASADGVAREMDRRRALAAQQEAEDAQRQRGEVAQAPGGFDVAEESSQAFRRNLREAKGMAAELELQNEQLDRTAGAMERGNESVTRLTKRIK